jgi:hypothetical protein
MRLKFFILFFLPCFLQAGFLLQEKMATAQPGDFLVTAQGRCMTLFIIEQNENQTLVVQEVTAPLNVFKTLQGKYEHWIQEGALGHLTWLKYKIDLNKGDLCEIYSFTHQGFIHSTQAGQILSKLLKLPFSDTASWLRKSREPGKPFQPPCIIHGKCVPGVKFTPYYTIWPNDGTELSQKEIIVYLLDAPTSYPSCLPYWIEVKGMVGRAHVRVIDAGKIKEG